MEQNLKSTSNKTMQHREIGLLMQYHELEMIHGKQVLTMPYSILFEFQVLGFICNTYCIMLFILRFEATLRKCLWPMLWRQHWLIVGYLCIDMPKM
jgi:hypothetical protein